MPTLKSRLAASAVGLLSLALWFSACGGGSESPSASPAPPPPAPVPTPWADWIRLNHHPLRSIDPADTDFADLQFFKEVIGDRRIVQLGESSHGVAEFDSAKVRLIRFLHQEMGFDAIAFESGLYECFRADLQAATASPDGTMKSSIFGVWWADETLPLFTYLKQTKLTDRPLTLAGFDVQVSSPSGVADRPDRLREVLGVIDEVAAQSAYDLDRLFLERQSSPGVETWLAGEQDRLGEQYRQIAAMLKANRSRLQAAFPTRPLLPLALEHSMALTPVYIAHILARTSSARDHGMADGLDGLYGDIYSGKKIIVWAHNAHIAHEDTGSVPMGSWIAERHRSELYTIGLFMNRGTAAYNDGRIYSIPPAPAGSVEAVFAHTGAPYAFADMLHAELSAGTEWMFRVTLLRDWGIYDRFVIPRNQFDAILYVDEVHPPRYR